MTQHTVAPIPHDFPFPICAVCQFPIPPYDLGGSEFRPRHASTCTPNGQQTQPAPRYGARAAAGQLGAVKAGAA